MGCLTRTCLNLAHYSHLLGVREREEAVMTMSFMDWMIRLMIRPITKIENTRIDLKERERDVCNFG